MLMLPLIFSHLVAQIAKPPPTATPSPAPTSTAPVYIGNPATHFALDARPLGFDPDGNARFLVVTRYLDGQNQATRILANSDIDWNANRGYVQWQTRMRYGQPAAIVKVNTEGLILLRVRSNTPRFGTLLASTDTRTWRGRRVVAEALGPHVIQIGWFPQESSLTRIVRWQGNGPRTTLSIIAGKSSTYRDASVVPGRSYRYIVYRAGHSPVKLGPVAALPAAPRTNIGMASGKAMWLFFSTNPTDANYYAKLDPQAIVAQAARAGLHYVELRTAYGAYWELDPGAKATIDAIIDGLAAHHILTMGWTVPRDTTFEDLQASLRTVYYRTAKGTPLAGLAVDVERGDEFMGSDPQGLPALGLYMKYLREAVGPHYLLVATIEDPYMEHLNEKKYPYRPIAQYSDVLQPMAYWRMLRRTPTTPAQVKTLLRATVARVQYLSRFKRPISIGGQTTAEGRNGNPSAEEITASLDAAKELHTLGECFFDWDGTQPYQWDAIAAYRW